MPRSRLARYALPASATIGAAAIALFSYGVFAHGLETKVRLLALATGVLLLFVAVTMIASRVVRPLAFLLGAPGARLGGTAGTLARQNAAGNPARTASTAAAVMIGLALITFFAVIGEGVRSSFTSSVNEFFVADYAVTVGDTPLTNKAAAAVRNPVVSLPQRRLRRAWRRMAPTLAAKAAGVRIGAPRQGDTDSRPVPPDPMSMAPASAARSRTRLS